jgi:hypothetical protein
MVKFDGYSQRLYPRVMILVSTSVVGSLSSEFGELGEDSNGDGNVTEGFAHDISISELKSEEVGSGGGITSPSSSSDETVPSVLDGFTELSWEHSGVGFLDDSKGKEGSVNELSGKVDETVHGALEISGGSRHMCNWYFGKNNYKFNAFLALYHIKFIAIQ